MTARARDIQRTTCGGNGVFICRCGGDICCCANDGFVYCPGCVECDFGGDPGYDDDQDWVLVDGADA